ncbi:PfkB family carbohydrate kinase [Streptomyces tendae]|uniref:PfkB family carbohydrate kinase n=1 Tax=Streptomyces TaxID=1883 RepID=UPI003F4D34A8
MNPPAHPQPSTRYRQPCTSSIVLVGLDEDRCLWDADLTPSGVREVLPCPRILVVKDGAEAATAIASEGVYQVPALATAMVEPVGAGDAFAAGFLAGMLTDATTTEALRPGAHHGRVGAAADGRSRTAAGSAAQATVARPDGGGVGEM